MSDIHTTRRSPEMERYVEIKPVVMEDFPDAHHVFLKVGNQSFCVTPHGCETKDDAEWHRDMLCVALAKVATDARAQPTPDPRIAELEAEVARLKALKRYEGILRELAAKVGPHNACKSDLYTIGIPLGLLRDIAEALPTAPAQGDDK